MIIKSSIKHVCIPPPLNCLHRSRLPTKASRERLGKLAIELQAIRLVLMTNGRVLIHLSCFAPNFFYCFVPTGSALRVLWQTQWGEHGPLVSWIHTVYEHTHTLHTHTHTHYHKKRATFHPVHKHERLHQKIHYVECQKEKQKNKERTNKSHTFTQKRKRRTRRGGGWEVYRTGWKQPIINSLQPHCVHTNCRHGWIWIIGPGQGRWMFVSV